MAYLLHTDADREAMLAVIGANNSDDLFASIPENLRHPAIDLPPPLGEQELVAELERLSTRNRPLSAYDSFLGAGVYRRFIPAIVKSTVSRPEFYTAYTPYQAEASQGTLQTIFEFQSMICALTGLDVANASLYDGATAAAEAMLLAVGHTGRSRVLVAADVHPETRAVMATFAEARKLQIEVQPWDSLGASLDNSVAALVVSQPGFLGTIIDPRTEVEQARAVGALTIACVDPIACTALLSPGEMGFDIAVGDGQPLGIPTSFGGPHVGFMAVRTPLMRRIPGRLVGLTTDHAGRRAYTLTLQTREQHIRREKATSNICTNHALMALAASVYMAHMGAGGMRAIAEVSAERAHHLARGLSQLPGWTLVDADAPFLWEFAIRVPGDAEQVAAELKARGVIGGLPLGRVDPTRGDQLLVCCTEMTSPASIDRYLQTAASIPVLHSRRSEVAGVAGQRTSA